MANKSVALNIFQYLITNIMTYNHSLNFLSFRRFIFSFQREGLTLILEKIYNEIKSIHDEHGEAITTSLSGYFTLLVNAFYACFSFNFNMTFFEYECEFEPTDTNILSVKNNFIETNIYSNIYSNTIK